MNERSKRKFNKEIITKICFVIHIIVTLLVCDFLSLIAYKKHISAPPRYSFHLFSFYFKANFCMI